MTYCQDCLKKVRILLVPLGAGLASGSFMAGAFFIYFLLSSTKEMDYFIVGMAFVCFFGFGAYYFARGLLALLEVIRTVGWVRVLEMNYREYEKALTRINEKRPDRLGGK